MSKKGLAMTVDASTGSLFEDDVVPEPMVHKKPELKHKVKIYWRNVFTLTYFHIASIYGLYLAFTNTKWQTFLFGKFFYFWISKLLIGSPPDLEPFKFLLKLIINFV